MIVARVLDPGSKSACAEAWPRPRRLDTLAGEWGLEAIDELPLSTALDCERGRAKRHLEAGSWFAIA